MLDIRTPVYKVQLRDFSVTDETKTDPSNANAFEQGQWWQLDPANAKKVIPAAAGDAVALCFPIFSKKGEGSTQLLDKVSVVYGGQFEADTDQYNTGETFTIGATLTVKLGVLTPAAGAEFVHAVVVLDPDNNSNKLRYQRLLGGVGV